MLLLLLQTSLKHYRHFQNQAGAPSQKRCRPPQKGPDEQPVSGAQCILAEGVPTDWLGDLIAKNKEAHGFHPSISEARLTRKLSMDSLAIQHAMFL